MQDTYNMLTRRNTTLESFDFTVKHKPGGLRVFRFHGQTQSRAVTREYQTPCRALGVLRG